MPPLGMYFWKLDMSRRRRATVGERSPASQSDLTLCTHVIRFLSARDSGSRGGGRGPQPAPPVHGADRERARREGAQAPVGHGYTLAEAPIPIHGRTTPNGWSAARPPPHPRYLAAGRRRTGEPRLRAPGARERHHHAHRLPARAPAMGRQAADCRWTEDPAGPAAGWVVRPPSGDVRIFRVFIRSPALP
jgi:hypothetical protein